MPDTTTAITSMDTLPPATAVPSAPCTPTKPSKTLKTRQEEDVSPCKTTTTSTSSSDAQSLTTAEDWYLQGERVWYDPQEKQIVEEDLQDEDGVEEQQQGQQRLRIFHRVVLPETKEEEEHTADASSCCPSTPERWMTFLPSNPEGSYGFHLVEEALSCSAQRKTRCDTDSTEESNNSTDCQSVTETAQEDSERPQQQQQQQQTKLARLYLDYQGQGDSDTPLPPPPVSPSNSNTTINSEEERHSPTKQRADLVEALWKANGIKRTVVVSAGDSSLVVMELLQRQRQRLAAGSPFPKILHVLSLNGRYVAKTRHSSQLATITQLLRSDRVGPSLAAKAQRSDFTINQCIQPYLKGSSRTVRRQVAQIVKRNEGAASLIDMARTVDDHLYEKHRYRWHLPHLLKVFTLDQGISFHMATNTRSGQRQVQLVQQQLDEYNLENCPGVQYSDYGGRTMSTSTFLLDVTHSSVQLDAFIKDIRRLANEEIPLSDNTTLHGPLIHSSSSGGRTLFEEEEEDHAVPAHHPGDEADEDDEDSWHPNEEEEDEDDEPSLDTRLQTEIVFDVNDMDDDDFDFF